MIRQNRVLALGAALVLLIGSSWVHATPYASQVTISGTQVGFVLNEDADSLTYSLNGGAATPLGDGTAAGLHTFNLNSGSDTFSIVANKTENGFLQLDGNTVAAAVAAMPAPAPEAYYTPVSNDTNINTHYIAPRGVAVGTNPNSPSFGAVYIGKWRCAHRRSGYGWLRSTESAKRRVRPQCRPERRHDEHRQLRLRFRRHGPVQQLLRAHRRQREQSVPIAGWRRRQFVHFRFCRWSERRFRGFTRPFDSRCCIGRNDRTRPTASRRSKPWQRYTGGCGRYYGGRKHEALYRR